MLSFYALVNLPCTCVQHARIQSSLICIASHDACMSVQLLYIVGHSACAGSNFKACLKCICACMQIWNFSSGECLKELEGISNQEITGIICLQVRLGCCCLCEPAVPLALKQYSPAFLSLHGDTSVCKLLPSMSISPSQCWASQPAYVVHTVVSQDEVLVLTHTGNQSMLGKSKLTQCLGRQIC